MRAITLTCTFAALLLSAYNLGNLHGGADARKNSSVCELRAMKSGASQVLAIHICNP